MRGRGWTAARELRVGDALRSHDGQWLAVEGVCDTGREEVVYNCRVAEYHTYFVGDESWGWSVWAHNSYDPKQTPIWSSTPSRTSIENAYRHWTKHASEFPEFHNAKQYVEAARNFVTNPPAGTLTKVRPNGEKVFYNPATNTFAVQGADGAPKTMFRPKDGINYWHRQ